VIDNREKEIKIMLCERCKKNEANYYYRENTNGVEKTYHLCADCARELAEDCFKDICKKADNFRQFNPNKPDEKLDAYLDNLLFDLVSRSLSAELSNVEVCYKPEEEEKVEDYIG
jgi:protein-arginine kinase activator protein McsA